MPPKYLLSVPPGLKEFESVSIWGMLNSDDAKITGITPPEFTRNGRCVAWPPMILRPTTRLAYCTGMRRSERSMRSEEHTSELQSHSFISYAVFCLKKK